MDGAQLDSPYHGLVGADAPAWVLPLIEAVQAMRDEVRRANLPRMREAITTTQNDLQTLQQQSSAAAFPEVKEEIETTKEQLKDLATESFISETLEEELKPVKADIDSMQKTLDGIKEGFNAFASGRFERATAYTNELYISGKKHSNKIRVHPNTLQQVPAPDGTLPWNTRVRGPAGEEIVLPPLVSLAAVQALGASQLGAYVQVY